MDAALNKVRRENPEVNIVESNAYWHLDFKSSKISLLTYSEKTNPLHYDKNMDKYFFMTYRYQMPPYLGLSIKMETFAVQYIQLTAAKKK